MALVLPDVLLQTHDLMVIWPTTGLEDDPFQVVVVRRTTPAKSLAFDSTRSLFVVR